MACHYNNMIIMMLSCAISQVIQMAYFALALTSDLMPILKVKAKLKAVCSYLLTIVCFPFAMVRERPTNSFPLSF